MGRHVRAVRTVVAAVCILLGAALIAVWLASAAALGTIDDSEAVASVAREVAMSEETHAAVSEQATAAVLDALESAGVDGIPGVEAVVEAIVAAVVDSQSFADAVQAQAGAAGQQVLEGVRSGSGPLVVTVDISDAVNERLETIPVVGPLLPDVVVAPIPVQVADAAAADQARSALDRLEWAARWAGWLGLGVIAVGFVVTTRRRWYVAKAAAAISAFCGLTWAAITFGDPAALAADIPGGIGGTAPGVVLDALARHAGPRVADAMAFAAIGAMIIAVVLLGAAWLLTRSRKKSE